MNTSSVIQDLISFLNESPTAWHAVESILSRLKKAGFIELDEKEAWNIRPQQGYVVTRNGSSLCAFITPRHPPKKVRLLASHTDSPALKLKPQPEIRKHQSIMLGVEVYGAPLLSSWLNRDLGIAGRVIYANSKGEILESTVRLDRYPVTIPQLAIHLDREVNEKGLQLNKQEHLNALAGFESSFPESSYLEKILQEKLDLDRLISHDLFLFPWNEPV